MLWLRNPAKLFGFTGLLLFLLRFFFPPDDSGNHLHSYVRLFDFRLDVAGYGFFEFAGIVFLLSALTYYLISRLTNSPPKPTLVHLHFWPSLVFAGFAIFLVYQVNDSPVGFSDPKVVVPINKWLTAFNWAFIVFSIIQLAFAISAGRHIWLSKRETPNDKEPDPLRNP